ncbi:MAG: Uma2 family endonuclease [Gemmataceae bacterium]
MIAHHFSVSQYHRMIQTEVLGENDRVELLEGSVVPKTTHIPPHDCAVSLAHASLLAALSKRWVVRVQSAITTEDSEPEPDLVVARGPARRYLAAHPHPEDIALTVEVADSTLDLDRIDKARIYARGGIPVYWIINLIDSAVEVYSRPSGRASFTYQQRDDYFAGNRVPLVISGKRIAWIEADDLLP